MLVALLHAAATWALTGLIWFVQIVHYPLFDRVGTTGFAQYELAHVSRTTAIVAPLMLAELGGAAWLVLDRPPALPLLAVWLGAALLAIIWVSTFALQVPQHDVLGGGFDARAHARLVGTNWIRTAAWTGRSLLAAWMLVRVARP